jgi:hypothetical protein
VRAQRQHPRNGECEGGGAQRRTGKDRLHVGRLSLLLVVE